MMPYSMKFEKKKIIIKFQKMKGTFLDSIPWLESHQSPLLGTYICGYKNFFVFSRDKKILSNYASV